MKNSLLTVSVLLVTVFALQAQEETPMPDTTKSWKTGGFFAFNFNQISLTNWSAGGQNSVSGVSLFNFFANYKKDKSSWDNNLDLGYGLLWQRGRSTIKTDDKIDFTSKFGQYAFRHWYYSALLNFKSQFAEGFNYPNDSVRISDFLAPAYMVLAIGLDYKPNERFNVLVAPITGKVTIVNSPFLADQGAFGVEKAKVDTAGQVVTPGKKIRYEFGGSVNMLWRQPIMENIAVLNKLSLFSNYIDRPENVDVNWEFLLTMKINKYFSATLNTIMIYDHDVLFNLDRNNDGITETYGPRIQFKQLFGVGFSYKF